MTRRGLKSCEKSLEIFTQSVRTPDAASTRSAFRCFFMPLNIGAFTAPDQYQAFPRLFTVLPTHPHSARPCAQALLLK